MVEEKTEDEPPFARATIFHDPNKDVYNLSLTILEDGRRESVEIPNTLNIEGPLFGLRYAIRREMRNIWANLTGKRMGHD